MKFIHGDKVYLESNKYPRYKRGIVAELKIADNYTSYFVDFIGELGGIEVDDSTMFKTKKELKDHMIKRCQEKIEYQKECIEDIKKIR